MKEHVLTSSTNPQENGISPFKVTQALVALGLEDKDESVMRYMNFLTGNVPFSAAYFVHVIPDIGTMIPIFEQSGPPMISEIQINEGIIKEMEQKVQEYIDKRDELYIEYDIKTGNPLEQLMLLGETLKADLLVIGQRSDTNRHGILAKNLVRKTEANALIVPENAKASISKILVPIDFSENSARALQQAIGLKKSLGKEVQIVCLNVYTVPNMSHYKLNRPWSQFKNIVEENIMDGFEAFLHTYAGAEKDSIEVALIEREMPGTARLIQHYAKENKFDFMILGAKGHSKVELLLLGSVTEKLMQLNENIPTLIVR